MLSQLTKAGLSSFWERVNKMKREGKKWRMSDGWEEVHFPSSGWFLWFDGRMRVLYRGEEVKTEWCAWSDLTICSEWPVLWKWKQTKVCVCFKMWSTRSVFHLLLWWKSNYSTIHNTHMQRGDVGGTAHTYTEGIRWFSNMRERRRLNGSRGKEITVMQRKLDSGEPDMALLSVWPVWVSALAWSDFE